MPYVPGYEPKDPNDPINPNKPGTPTIPYVPGKPGKSIIPPEKPAQPSTPNNPASPADMDGNKAKEEAVLPNTGDEAGQTGLFYGAAALGLTALLATMKKKKSEDEN